MCSKKKLEISNWQLTVGNLQKQNETQQKTIESLQVGNKNSEIKIEKLEAALERLMQTTLPVRVESGINKEEAKK